jgi:hypothetical protein
MPGLVILDNHAINRLAGDATIRAKLSFLGKTRQRKACCNRCGGDEPDYEAIRTTIAHLDGASKNLLKEALGAETIRVYHRDAQRKVHTVEF